MTRRAVHLCRAHAAASKRKREKAPPLFWRCYMRCVACGAHRAPLHLCCLLSPSFGLRAALDCCSSRISRFASARRGFAWRSSVCERRISFATLEQPMFKINARLRWWRGHLAVAAPLFYLSARLCRHAPERRVAKVKATSKAGVYENALYRVAHRSTASLQAARHHRAAAAAAWRKT